MSWFSTRSQMNFSFLLSFFLVFFFLELARDFMKWTWPFLATVSSCILSDCPNPGSHTSTKQHLIISYFTQSMGRPSKFCFMWVKLLWFNLVPFSTSPWPKSLFGSRELRLCVPVKQILGFRIAMRANSHLPCFLGPQVLLFCLFRWPQIFSDMQGWERSSKVSQSTSYASWFEMLIPH